MLSLFDSKWREIVLKRDDIYFLSESGYYSPQSYLMCSVHSVSKDLTKNFSTFKEFELGDRDTCTKRAAEYDRMGFIIRYPEVLSFLSMPEDRNMIIMILEYLKTWSFTPSNNELSRRIIEFVLRMQPYILSETLFEVKLRSPLPSPPQDDEYHLFKVMRNYKMFDKHLFLETMKFQSDKYIVSMSDYPTLNGKWFVEVKEYLSKFPTKGIRYSHIDHDDYVTIVSKEGSYLPPIRKSLLRMFQKHPEIKDGKMYVNSSREMILIFIAFMEKPQIFDSITIAFIVKFCYLWNIDVSKRNIIVGKLKRDLSQITLPSDMKQWSMQFTK